MPYTAPHNVLQVLGEITSEGEVDQWSFGLRFGEGNRLMGQDLFGPDDPSTTAVMNAITADLTLWWNTVAGIFSNQVRMTGHKFNAVGADGKMLSATTTYRRERATPLLGTGSGMVPPQCSVALTLRTNVNRGLANKGRVYMPPVTATLLDAGGRLAQASTEFQAIEFAKLLTNLSNWAGVDATNDYGKVCVMSKVRLGATRRVNAVDVGDLFDTMRSRRAQLKEHRGPKSVVTS